MMWTSFIYREEGDLFFSLPTPKLDAIVDRIGYSNTTSEFSIQINGVLH